MGDIAEDSDIEEEFHAVLEKIKTEDIKTEPNFEFINIYVNDAEIITVVDDDDRRSERLPQFPSAPRSTPWRAAKKRPGTRTVTENLNLNRSTAPKTYKGPKSVEPETLPRAKAKPSTLCRLCATRSFVTVPIFGKDKVYENIVQKIEHCLSVVVKRTDTLPQRVCRECLEKLEFCHSFHESVARAEKQLTILDNKRSNKSPTGKEEKQRLVPIMLTASKEEINVSRRGLDSLLKRKRIGEEIPQVGPDGDNFLSNLRLDWDELIPAQSDGDVFEDQSSELFYDPPKIKLGSCFTVRKSRGQFKEMLRSSEDLSDYRVHPSPMVRTYQARHKQRREANEDDVIVCDDEVSTEGRFRGVSLQTTKKRYGHERAHISAKFYPCSICKRSFDTEREWADHKEREKTCERTSVGLSDRNESEKKFLAEFRTKFQKMRDQEEQTLVRECFCIICGIRYRNWEELEAHENQCGRRTPKANDCRYTCGHCGRGFVRKSTMLMHVKNHVGTKRLYEYQNLKSQKPRFCWRIINKALPGSEVLPKKH